MFAYKKIYIHENPVDSENGNIAGFMLEECQMPL